MLQVCYIFYTFFLLNPMTVEVRIRDVTAKGKGPHKNAVKIVISLSLSLWIFSPNIILWGWVELIKTKKTVWSSFRFILGLIWCLYRSGRHQGEKKYICIFCVESCEPWERNKSCLSSFFSLYFCLRSLLHTKFT